MALIVAIEPDREQAAQITTIARGRVGAELVLADSAERALRELGDRIPDLILTPQLMSPRDDAAITDRLRELGEAATHVQTLTIPALATEQPKTAARGRGLFAALRRQKAPSAAPAGCAPDVFAEQIAGYLERALEGRAKGDHAEQAPLAAPVFEPRFEPPVVEPPYEPMEPEPRFEPLAPEPRFEPPMLEPPFELPVFESRLEAPTFESRLEAPTFESRLEAPTFESRLEAPIFEPRLEAPIFEPRFEPPIFEARPEQPAAEADLTDVIAAVAEPAAESLPEIAEVVEPAVEVVPELAVIREIEVVVEPSVAPIAEPVPGIAVEVVERKRAPKAAKPATKKRKKQAADKDDLSFFDPEETRFAALIARLDEITRTDALGHS